MEITLGSSLREGSVSTIAADRVECHPMIASDVEAAVAIFVSTSHHDVPPESQARLAETFEHFITHDPGGCWLATSSEIPIGFAAAIRRDDLWVLPALYVSPAQQAGGVGGALLARGLAYAGEAARGMLTSSGDPRATRVYGNAGLAPHPTLYAAGRPHRALLPGSLEGRQGSSDDLELMADVDLHVRGATRVQDLAFLLEQGVRSLVVDSGRRHGYVLFRDGEPPIDGMPMMLTATDVGTARALLWQMLAEASGDVLIPALTPSRHWAFEIALAARLRLLPGGPFFVSGMADLPAPWIASGFFG